MGTAVFPCPNCQADLVDEAAVNVGTSVQASQDPEGIARLELIVHCDACEEDFYAFLSADQLISEGELS